ncbi:carbohydrate-binding domain-containing protein [uncultured Prevotella sp.]|uniref:carbohydrate-binding domain-containing protein n=1 Tax=uncultured Prevotella sp. TaxID=159272 RepID=UPI0025E1EAD8|nr:carbohydrate-binding domain-containing protein [uncultured Prevotella sp.]
MKKLSTLLLAALAFVACSNDDNYTWDDNFADRTNTDTILIAINYQGDQVTVEGDAWGYVSASGAHVTVKSSANRFLQLQLSGTTTDGSLLIYSWKKVGVLLNGVSITNPHGPAINNQCGKSFIVTTAPNTVNTLADGAEYQMALGLKGDTISQKATLFSEGQIYLRGTGTLQVNAQAKNGIASDDFIVVEGGTINVNVAATGSNGIKTNDGFTINGGTLTVSVAAKGARGIKNDARTTIAGGTTTITTTGDCLIETVDGITDTTSCAGIRCDSLFQMTAGQLTITSSGDGGKGINSDQQVLFQGGKLLVTTTGGNQLGKPKAVKASNGIIVSGGTFQASCLKSWACDNGSDSDEPEDHITVNGTPTTKIIQKRNVHIAYSE